MRISSSIINKISTTRTNLKSGLKAGALSLAVLPFAFSPALSQDRFEISSKSQNDYNLSTESNKSKQNYITNAVLTNKERAKLVLTQVSEDPSKGTEFDGKLKYLGINKGAYTFQVTDKSILNKGLNVGEEDVVFVAFYQKEDKNTGAVIRINHPPKYEKLSYLNSRKSKTEFVGGEKRIFMDSEITRTDVEMNICLFSDDNGELYRRVTQYNFDDNGKFKFSTSRYSKGLDDQDTTKQDYIENVKELLHKNHYELLIDDGEFQ